VSAASGEPSDTGIPARYRATSEAVANRLFCPEALLITRSEIRRAIGILVQYFIVSVRFFGGFWRHGHFNKDPTTFRIKTLGHKGKIRFV